jgi:4'-phosphopantetheinyl transferase
MSEMLHWLVQSLPDITDNDDWLSEDERKILSRMRFPKRRSDWRLGRWTAKQAICAYQIKRNPALPSLEIRAASDGAPEAFWDDGSPGVSISISHSKNRSLCVVGRRDISVGCDLEWVEAREDGLMQDYFSPEEIILTTQAPLAERDLMANLIWSAKETVLKVLRQGLRRDTRSICIRLDSFGRGEEWNTWTGRCTESSRDFSGWWRLCEGYVYTLAADQPTSSPKQLLRGITHI